MSTLLTECLLVWVAISALPIFVNAESLEPQKLEYCRPYQGPLVSVGPLLSAINDPAFTRDVARELDAALEFRQRQKELLTAIERKLMGDFRNLFDEIKRVEVTEWNIASVMEKQPGSRIYGLTHARLPEGMKLEETRDGVLITNLERRNHYLVGPATVFYPGDAFKLTFRLPEPTDGPSHFRCYASLLNHEGRNRILFHADGSASSDKLQEFCAYVTAGRYLVMTNGKLSRVPRVSVRGDKRPAPVRLMFALWPKARIEIVEFYRSPIVALATDIVQSPEATGFKAAPFKPAGQHKDH